MKKYQPCCSVGDSALLGKFILLRVAARGLWVRHPEESVKHQVNTVQSIITIIPIHLPTLFWRYSLIWLFFFLYFAKLILLGVETFCRDENKLYIRSRSPMCSRLLSFIANTFDDKGWKKRSISHSLDLICGRWHRKPFIAGLIWYPRYAVAAIMWCLLPYIRARLVISFFLTQWHFSIDMKNSPHVNYALIGCD